MNELIKIHWWDFLALALNGYFSKMPSIIKYKWEGINYIGLKMQIIMYPI